MATIRPNVSVPTASTVSVNQEVPKSTLPTKLPGSKSYKQYFTHMAGMNMVMADGRFLKFVGSRYLTELKDEIEFIEAEIARGNTRIYIKPGAETISADSLAPVDVLRAKHFEEFRQMQAAADMAALAGAASSNGMGSNMGLSNTASLGGQSPAEAILAAAEAAKAGS